MTSDAAGTPETAAVAAGYDAVYTAMPRSPTLARIWREHVLGDDYPDDFAHISFLTLAELQRMTDALALARGQTLVDLACGGGGPGLWVARETGARLIGIDISAAGIALAARRAERVGLASQATFGLGSFAATGLADASIDAAMSVDALQYAPDKRAAFREAARIFRPGGRLAFFAFELEPGRVAGLPVLGTDPTGDFAPPLADAGLDVTTYEETPGWWDVMSRAYGAIVNAQPALTAEMGEAAARALLGETTLTLQIKPYRRRVFVAAVRR